MVYCSYVGICFGVEHHHMPDGVLHLAWRTKDHKNWSQDHGRIWAVRGAHIRRGFEGKMGMYLGIGLWSLSSMNTRLQFHACFEPSINGNLNFEHIFDIWPIWCELAVFCHVMSSNS